MFSQAIPFYCGPGAVDHLLGFCQAHGDRRFALICDRNTYSVLGRQVEAGLHAQGWDAATVILDGREVVADERSLAHVLFQLDGQPRTYLAVGSGTLTDIARFCSHRSRNPLISVPTAPSVDGYASIIAAVVMGGFKVNAWAQPPLAIFADLGTLCAAPTRMIAAGFGDLLGKYTALADWELDHLLWGEPYRPEIDARAARALAACVSQVELLRQAAPEGVARLMDGLVESGLCMLENGNSRPASGAEHHLSHYWEMKLLRLGRPAVLHGAKVGIGTLLIAGRYEQIRRLGLPEVEQRLRASRLPDRQAEMAAIEAAYGALAPQVVAEQRPFLDLTSTGYEELKGRIRSSWGEIRRIAARVPPAGEVLRLLECLGAPTRVASIGMDSADEQEALQTAHYLRAQFTVTKLGRVLNMW